MDYKRAKEHKLDHPFVFSRQDGMRVTESLVQWLGLPVEADWSVDPVAADNRKKQPVPKT